jgi:serine/threonine protein kinase
MTQNDDNNQTGTYDSSKNEKTGFYGSDAGATFAYATAAETVSRSKSHGIGIGDIIVLREKNYTVTDIISEGTGEAVIYKIENNEKQTLALKLYFEFSNAREEPNPETLRRIREIIDPDILKLHDFGVGNDKYLEKYCYEICDYAEGGDLFTVEDFRDEYTPQFIEKTIVPEIYKGIRRLHQAKIYHCDLKPQNVFFLDRNRTDIVIGDYGSAKAYELESLNTARKSTLIKGTEAYLAPEQGIGIISGSNDYYSFGIILLHLLYPESLCADTDLRTVDRRKINTLKERQYNFQPVIGFDPKYKRLNDLIAGLTLHNHQNRWGEKEVTQWLAGKSPEVKYEGSSVLPIKLGRATIRTDKELIAFIESNSDSWYRDLIQDAYETLKNWLDSYRDVPTRMVFDKMVKFYKSYGADFVKEAVIRFFQPDRQVISEFDFFDIYKSPDVATDTKKFIAKIDEIWKHSRLNTKAHLERLSFYLFQMEFALRQRGEQLNGIYKSLRISAKSFDDFQTEIQDQIISRDEDAAFRYLIDLFYVFDPERTYRDLNNNPISTLEELGLFYAKNEAAFSDKILIIEKEKFLTKLGRGHLAGLNYKDFIFEIFKNKAENRLDLLSLSFDKSRNYKINYTFYKSLTNFLSKNGIAKEFTSRSDHFERFETRRKFFQKFSDVGEKFISDICLKHNISKLASENRAQISEQFRRSSRDRFLYLHTNFLFGKSSNKSLSQLKQEEIIAQGRFFWKPAAGLAVVSMMITVSLLILLAYSWGWIPKPGIQYLTFNNPVKLDGMSFAAGDYLEISNNSEYSICTRNRDNEKCYPTATTALILNRQGNLAIDAVGKIDYEFSQPREVFKVTKGARLGSGSYSVGSVVDLTKNSSEQFCFNVPGKDKCYTRRSACRGNGCNDTIDEYGHAISNYRGKRLLTFTQNTSIDGVTVPKGTVWEATKETVWSNCLKAPSGEKCFLTAAALNRLKQPDVPVISNFGTIGTRQVSISNFGYGLAGFCVLGIAGALFYGAAGFAKKIRLFVLRNEINTLEFKS